MFVGGGGSSGFGFVTVLVIGFGLILVGLSGIGIASGGAFSSTFGSDFVSPFESLATMFSVCTCGRGKGILLTRLALIASPPIVSPPQLLPDPRFTTAP